MRKGTGNCPGMISCESFATKDFEACPQFPQSKCEPPTQVAKLRAYCMSLHKPTLRDIHVLISRAFRTLELHQIDAFTREP